MHAGYPMRSIVQVKAQFADTRPYRRPSNASPQFDGLAGYPIGVLMTGSD
jgi:hypothetical protein